MTDTVIRVFRSDFKVVSRLLVMLAIAGAVLLVSATVIGQLRADRFPSYVDLGLSLIVAPAACAALGLFFYVAVRLFPVKLLADGLRCYDVYARYRSIKWSDVTAVEFIVLWGLKYLVIHASTITQPITLPIYLDNMDEFRRMVEAQTGRDHLVAQALRAVVT